MASADSPSSASGGQPGPPSESSSGHGYRVTYRLRSTFEQNFDRVEVLTDGAKKVRINVGGDVLVSNGVRAVDFTPNDDGGFGAGSTHAAVAVKDVDLFVVHKGDGTLQTWCAEAHLVGAAKVLGRSSHHFTCRDPGDQLLFRAKELWVDQKTGLILKWTQGSDSATATQVDVDAPLAPDAFSLLPPTGSPDASQDAGDGASTAPSPS